MVSSLTFGPPAWGCTSWWWGADNLVTHCPDEIVCVCAYFYVMIYNILVLFVARCLSWIELSWIVAPRVITNSNKTTTGITLTSFVLFSPKCFPCGLSRSCVCVCVVHIKPCFSTRRHPAHSVSVLVLYRMIRVTSCVFRLRHRDSRSWCSTVRRLANAVPCHRAGCKNTILTPANQITFVSDTHWQRE